MEYKDLSGKKQEAPKEENPLKSLERDLKLYAEPIKEVSDEMLDAMLTKFPVFIAHQHQVDLGELMLNRDELGTQWSIQASTLEELVEKKLVLPERREHFEESYKDPRKFMCLLVIVPQGANFVFYPFK